MTIKRREWFYFNGDWIRSKDVSAIIERSNKLSLTIILINGHSITRNKEDYQNYDEWADDIADALGINDIPRRYE